MLTVVLLLLTVFLSGSHQQCLTDKDFVGYYTSAELYSWIKTRLTFSISLMKAINNEHRNENIIFSPWSIQESLLLAYFGAKEETEASLAKTLQIPAKQTKALTWRFYHTEKQDYADKNVVGNNFPVKSANKVYVSNKLKLRPCMETKFETELESIDYERDSGIWAKHYINGWVASVTEGLIKDLVQDLSPESKSTLVNAVYFKSKWMDKFNSSNTRKMSFYVSPPRNYKNVEMMVKKGVFRHGYSKPLGARVLLLPYEGNRISMIVLLPEGDLDPMIAQMNPITLAPVTDVNVYKTDFFELVIPKYDQRSKIFLNKTLESLGIGKTLTESADFSGFTGKKEVFFNQFVHESVIQVDEEGTKAAGSTANMAEPLSLNMLNFYCNRPFAYIIYDFVAGKFLFMGTFRDPKPV